MVAIACRVRPDQVTLVPERREEVTTEGGLDVVGRREAVATAVARLREAGIGVSLFIDPDPQQIDAAVDAGGRRGRTPHRLLRQRRAARLPARRGSWSWPGPERWSRRRGWPWRPATASPTATSVPVARLDGMGELNIGHSIVARAVFVGMTEAVREMRRLITA